MSAKEHDQYEHMDPEDRANARARDANAARGPKKKAPEPAPDDKKAGGGS